MKRSLLILLSLTLLSAPAAAQSNPTAEEATRILTALVRIDTSNPPGNEIKAAEYIRDLLAREGIASEIFESAPGRASIVARLKGNGSKRPLLIMGHLDVVGVERDKWSTDPFTPTVQEGYLYGRGSTDDKGMDAANLAVLLRIKREKLPLDRDIIFLAEAGEEGTSQYGIDFLVEKHWDKIECEYALNEGGLFHSENGKLLYAGVSSTEKVPRGMKLTARGTSGHGSMPRMDNAVTHLAAAVARIGAWQTPMKLNATTREFFSRLAKISTPEDAYLYTHLEDPDVQKKLRETKLFNNSMLRTSIVPTIIKGGFRENVIPAEAEATLDVRAVPDEDIPALMDTMMKMIDDPHVVVSRTVGGQQRPASPPSAIDNEIFHALERAQAKVWPEAITLPLMQTGATDSAQLRAKGVQAYGIGIPLSDDDLRRVHGNNERISLDALGKFTDYLYTVVVDVAGSKK